jgi:hypothetical protein
MTQLVTEEGGNQLVKALSMQLISLRDELGSIPYHRTSGAEEKGGYPREQFQDVRQYWLAVSFPLAIAESCM